MAYFDDVKNYASFLRELSPDQLTILSSFIGVLLSKNLDAYESQSLGNVLELVGQVLLTYSSQIQLLNDRHD